ncbi:medium-chain acyl-[acyl-carrier-protein] hydrolase [Anaerobacterium chartisolvens]|uniref:Medium-chain acyl-[acyl-carrier-protein] hydrolase n=1 Tax=Anaerobacterium chartisolvens TaxID=1297424 RepID=A0A369BAJ6_9FIRM|nr:thioesterase domain-containing protein [Anaerobacterium chartisolvens]RCX18345.1 medium-chain acyl-[acyl-carrier-protein] hydrolase [Anaerobacterium chartisolvens]
MRSVDRKWIVNKKPNSNARIRLFCFPFAGGAASVFHSWISKLPEYIEVCSIQLPGRENRFSEKPYTSIGPLVDDLMKDIIDYFYMPYAFFGYSLGATICFELAQKLRQNMHPQPMHLFISGNTAPHIPDEEIIHNIPQVQFIEKIRQYNGTPDFILNNKELMDVFIPILRADLELEETYRYSCCEPFEYPITVFGGEDDLEVSIEGLMEWNKYTTDRFSMKMFPGGHFFLREAQIPLLQCIVNELKLTGNMLKKL